MNSYSVGDMVRFQGQSIVSARSLMEHMYRLANPLEEIKQIYREEGRETRTMGRHKFYAEIEAPKGYDETQQGFRWSPPVKTANDLEALRLWVTQYLLDNPTIERSQAALYQVVYTRLK